MRLMTVLRSTWLRYARMIKDFKSTKRFQAAQEGFEKRYSEYFSNVIPRFTSKFDLKSYRAVVYSYKLFFFFIRALISFQEVIL
jgi:hypothetical protein